MTRTTLGLAITLTVLGLGACSETMAPTKPGTARSRSPAISSLALSSNSWTATAPMPEERWRFAAAASVLTTTAGQSVVYVLGGRYSQSPMDPPASTILSYDVTTNTWTTKAARFMGAGTNGIGKIGSKLYISGGWDFTGDFSQWIDASSSLFAYDLVRDRVTRKANMPRGTAYGITGVINSKLYVLAGKCFQASCNSFYRYDPATNAWTTLAPAPNSHIGGAGVVIAGKFYVAGGGLRPFRSFDVYDPLTNTWTTLAPMPPRRELAVGTTLQGKFYVIGFEPGGDRNTVAYDPVTKTWRNRAPFPEAEPGQTISHPSAALRVKLDGRSHILTVGSGLLLAEGGAYPAPSQMYTP